MRRKILKGLHPALSTPHLYAPLHSCTLTRLHAYTLARGIAVDDAEIERQLQSANFLSAKIYKRAPSKVRKSRELGEGQCWD
jgi:hypothetical protein